MGNPDKLWASLSFVLRRLAFRPQIVAFASLLHPVPAKKERHECSCKRATSSGEWPGRFSPNSRPINRVVPLRGSFKRPGQGSSRDCGIPPICETIVRPGIQPISIVLARWHVPPIICQRLAGQAKIEYATNPAGKRTSSQCPNLHFLPQLQWPFCQSMHLGLLLLCQLSCFQSLSFFQSLLAQS